MEAPPLSKQGKPASKTGLTGKVLGIPIGIGPPPSQENNGISREDNITTNTPPLGLPRGLLMKVPTLGGSLTFPANP